ncbi:conserved hypothetical protein [Ixodes scapularis]|uniref:C2H2-type domain-containing protein n=3 Tax=Ixodes TaxID=6944 RepID=B7PI84_IXOSC|nr:conserved hypothetical protein [Ixodes scapularis]|eukprot:XP_002404663.1 conserved hypothetical protein [Ixodes scapularis]
MLLYSLVSLGQTPAERGTMAWHKCGTCGKRFAFLKSLEEHQRTHSNSASVPTPATFECELCALKFALLSEYRSHTSEHHCGQASPGACADRDQSYALDEEEADGHYSGAPLKGFECEGCAKRFATAFSRERHYQRKHGTTPCSQERGRYHVKDYKVGRSLVIARTVR